MVAAVGWNFPAERHFDFKLARIFCVLRRFIFGGDRDSQELWKPGLPRNTLCELWTNGVRVEKAVPFLRRQPPPQPPSPRVESASWFSGDPESERELVDASELRTVWKGGQESCNLERERGAPVNHPSSPCEEVEAGMASTRPRGNYLVYAEPKEMEFSEGDAVEWVQNHSYGAESQPDGL